MISNLQVSSHRPMIKANVASLNKAAQQSHPKGNISDGMYHINAPKCVHLNSNCSVDGDDIGDLDENVPVIRGEV